jgi:TRAP-type C4-dicarboxylate transport system permease large subunit
MVGSFIFMRFITLSGIPSLIRDNVANLTISKYWIVIAVIIFYLITGAIFDAFSAVTLTIAISYPLMLGLGYDPIWFGVLITKLIMIGQYTPPIGMTVFVSAGALNVPAGEIFRGVWPFLISDFAQLALLVIFPAYPLLLVR